VAGTECFPVRGLCVVPSSLIRRQLRHPTISSKDIWEAYIDLCVTAVTWEKAKFPRNGAVFEVSSLVCHREVNS